jgi:hypothetical protein
MIKRFMERGQTLLNIRKMGIKTPRNYHLILVRMATTKRPKITSAGRVDIADGNIG